MIKNISKLFVLFTLFGLLLSCSNSATKSSSAPVVKTGVPAIADTEIAVIEMEEPAYGKFTMELYSNLAPEMVKRFKELSREGFYNGTAFHRINSAVVQGGDPLSKDPDSKLVGTGNSSKPNVVAEFSDIQYESGIVGAARKPGDNNSQNCQFLLHLKEPEFDKEYTIFGKITDGMNNIRIIAGAPRDGEKPLEPIKIKSITIQTK